VVAKTEDVSRVDDRIAFLENDRVGTVHQIGSGSCEERRTPAALLASLVWSATGASVGPVVSTTASLKVLGRRVASRIDKCWP